MGTRWDGSDHSERCTVHGTAQCGYDGYLGGRLDGVTVEKGGRLGVQFWAS